MHNPSKLHTLISVSSKACFLHFTSTFKNPIGLMEIVIWKIEKHAELLLTY